MSLKDYQIILETNELLAINKPSACHSTGENSLESILLADNLLNKELENNGLLQRLDFETSGLLLAAKTSNSYNELKKIISNHLWEKKYLVLTENMPTKPLIYECYLGSRYRGSKKVSISEKPKARFLYAKIETELVKNLNHKSSLLRVKTSYGRRHQVRAMLADLGYPLIGDELYGAKNKTNELGSNFPKFILHAESIRIPKINSVDLPSILECPLPNYLEDLL